MRAWRGDVAFRSVVFQNDTLINPDPVSSMTDSTAGQHSLSVLIPSIFAARIQRYPRGR